jgi:hypothetical protein
VCICVCEDTNLRALIINAVVNLKTGRNALSNSKCNKKTHETGSSEQHSLM